MRNKKFCAPLVLLSLLAIFLFSVVLLFSFRRDERKFTELTSELFKNELLPNTLNMHYTVAYPKNLGIYSYDATLPTYSHKQELVAHAQLENYIDILNAIDSDELENEDCYTYNLLKDYLNMSLQGSSYKYYDEPLSPGSGIQSQFPILMAEYTFRCRQDVEDYLSIMEQLPNYFDGFIHYEQEKAEAGLLMADYSIDKVILQCDSIIEEETLSQETHFLQTTFNERIDKLLDAGVINKKEASIFISTNNRLLTTVVLPAYEKLGDSLILLKGRGNNGEGLAHYPQGKDYYGHLIHKSTGSSENVENIKKYLYTYFDKEYKAFKDFAIKNRQLFEQENLTPDASLFPLISPESILEDLQQRMMGDFPALPSDQEEAYPICSVKSVSHSLEDFSAPAFYLTPPLDDSSSNVIYINEQDCPNGLALYTTLAHEGYPGHLYQSVFHQQYRQNNDLNPVREILWYGGYLEGWALYTEFIAYDYAIDIIKESGHEKEAIIYELEKYNRNLQLCLFSIVDIAIHYDGASLENVAALLSSFGITSPDTARSIYEYIVEEPANYLKYYWGYMNILMLKEEARTLWGTGYSDLLFHTFYLECGPADFDNLSIRLRDYALPGDKVATVNPTSARSGRMCLNPQGLFEVSFSHPHQVVQQLH